MNKEQAITAATATINRILDANTVFLPSEEGTSVSHLISMVSRMTEDEFSENKAMRWLGYIQGVAVTRKFLSLEEVKEISRVSVHGSK